MATSLHANRKPKTKFLTSSSSCHDYFPSDYLLHTPFDPLMELINPLEFVKQNCPKYDGTGNSKDFITWFRRVKPHVMYLQGHEHRQAFEFLLVGDAREYYLSLEARPSCVEELGGIFCPKLDKDGTLRQQFQRSTSTLSSNVQLTRPGTRETLEITNALSAPSSHSARHHRFHAQHERDYVLARSVTSSPSDITLVSTLHIDTAQCTDVDNNWPPGSNSWCSSVPLPPRQSHLILSPHRFHSQHEQDYLLTKSFSSSSSGFTRVSTPSNYTLQCAVVQSVWPDGFTSWFSDPLPPRSPRVSLDAAVPALPTALFSPISEHGIRITFTSVAYMVASSVSQTDPDSAPSFFSCRQQSLYFSFSAILLAFWSFIWLLFTSARLSSRIDGHGAFTTARDLHPVPQLWHVMVP